MKNKKIKNYTYRMDFDIEEEYSENGEKTGNIIFMPNRDRYEYTNKDGVNGYMDKYEPIFIPEEMLQKVWPQLNFLPVNMPPSRIENPKEYFKARFKNLSKYFSDEFKSSTLNSAENLVFMSLDIVNSTRRSKKLDIETNTLTNLMFLKEAEEIIKIYEGNVIKYVGDGLIAYFQTPNLMGKIDNSIECALLIKTFVEEYINKFLGENEITPLKFRIGINHGEGYIININEQNDIYGHALDITHKIQECADENQIVVGSKSKQLAHTYWKEKLEKIDFDYKKEKKPELENITLYKLNTE